MSAKSVLHDRDLLWSKMINANISEMTSTSAKIGNLNVNISETAR